MENSNDRRIAFTVSMHSIIRIAERENRNLRTMCSISSTEFDLKHFYRNGRKILGAALNYR